MSSTTLTHKDLAESLGVSETTIKSYRRKFPGCIPVASGGKPIRFTESALTVTQRIQEHFAIGMSIEEVRLRLANEFSWVSPTLEKPPKAAPQAAGPEITQGLSTVAKSMVSMGQQQNSILKRMESIEAQLQGLGLGGAAGVGATEAEAPARGNTAALMSRLDSLENITGTLVQSLAAITHTLDALVAPLSAQAMGGAQDTAATEPEPAEKPSTVVPFASRGSGAQHISPQAASAPVGGPAAANFEEPARFFFTLPLVVRAGDGRYISAGSRGRGRLCVNDLKAMLIYGFTPPNHYTLQWEQGASGWWLHLEQPENPGSDPLSLFLVELTAQAGGQNVIEVAQLKRAGQALHPAEICGIVDSLTG